MPRYRGQCKNSLMTHISKQEIHNSIDEHLESFTMKRNT